MGDLPGSIEELTDAVRLLPGSATLYLERGNGRTLSGQFMGALTDYDEAIRLDPGLVDAYVRGATEAIRLDPGLVDAYERGATSRVLTSNYEGAIRDSNEAPRLEPNSTRA